MLYTVVPWQDKLFPQESPMKTVILWKKSYDSVKIFTIRSSVASYLYHTPLNDGSTSHNVS